MRRANLLVFADHMVCSASVYPMSQYMGRQSISVGRVPALAMDSMDPVPIVICACRALPLLLDTASQSRQCGALFRTLFVALQFVVGSARIVLLQHLHHQLGCLRDRIAGQSHFEFVRRAV